MELRVADKDNIEDRLKIFEGADAFIEFMDMPKLFPTQGSDNIHYAISKFLDHPTSGVILAEDDGKLLGGIGGILLPYIWDHDKLVCEELFWWVSDTAPPTTALRLIRAHEKAGKLAGADVFLYHSMTKSPAGVDRLYKKLGAEPIQTSYVRTE